jgi:hypothetical protein
MTQRRKLLQKALASPSSLRFKELCTLATQLGFVFDRTRGSHFIFRHDRLRRPLNFQDVAGNAKPFQVQQLLDAAREIGIIEEEM